MIIEHVVWLELTDGKMVLARMPMVDGEYDLASLAERVLSLKRDHPDSDDASVLLEPDIEYDHLIQVMDVLRSADLPSEAGREPTRLALFTDVSIGDAP